MVPCPPEYIFEHPEYSDLWTWKPNVSITQILALPGAPEEMIQAIDEWNREMRKNYEEAEKNVEILD